MLLNMVVFILCVAPKIEIFKSLLSSALDNAQIVPMEPRETTF